MGMSLPEQLSALRSPMSSFTKSSSSIRGSDSSTCSSSASRSSTDNKQGDKKKRRKKKKKKALPLAYSGWIFVSIDKRKKKFARRYCKLRDVFCTFKDDVSTKALDEDKHMIISIRRLVEVNHGMAIVNHTGKEFWIYTELAEEYDTWYRAFSDGLILAENNEAIRSRSLRNLPVSVRDGDVLPRASSSFSGRISRGSAETKASIASLRSASSLNLDNNIEKTGWVLKECSQFFVKRMKRRYLVLNGVRLSYFEVNIEGHEAEGVGNIVQVMPWTQQPNGLDILLDNGTHVRVATKKADDCKEWVSIIQQALASKAANSM